MDQLDEYYEENLNYDIEKEDLDEKNLNDLNEINFFDQFKDDKNIQLMIEKEENETHKALMQYYEQMDELNNLNDLEEDLNNEDENIFFDNQEEYINEHDNFDDQYY